LLDFKSLNFIRSKVSLTVWHNDSQEDVLEGSISDVVINCKDDVIQQFLLGHDCVIKIVNNVKDEQMGDLINNHFLEWLLN
jgi:hypothetical protein